LLQRTRGPYCCAALWIRNEFHRVSDRLAAPIQRPGLLPFLARTSRRLGELGSFQAVRLARLVDSISSQKHVQDVFLQRPIGYRSSRGRQRRWSNTEALHDISIKRVAPTTAAQSERDEHADQH